MSSIDFSKHIVFITIILYFNVQHAYGKHKILVLMPYSGKSHFLFAEPLFEELARRGNDVTVVSHFPKKTPFRTYHDISMAGNISDAVHSKSMKDIASEPPILEMMVFFSNGLNRVCREGLAHPNVQKLLNSNEKYDLAIVEMFNADCFLGFVHKFDVPLVFIRSSALSTWLTERSGNPDNPSYVPGTTSGNPSRMSFLQRLHNSIYYVVYKLLYRIYGHYCEAVAKQHFGEDMPALEDIARNASLYLVNTHYVHQYAKPLVPGVKEIAGLHVRKPMPLSDDLENWISGARQGLIYFNLGSMLNPSSMAEDKKLAILETFARLPHRVLMKWGKNDIQGLPANIKLTTWAPQNDILHHPNVKLFITHGGMLGTVEALHAGVPMVIIPFFGDQLTNAALLEEKRLGLILKYIDITLETFNSTLHKVLYDPRFAARAKQLSAAFRDRPIQPLEEAAYWVEYVARHKGLTTEIMHSPALHMSLYQYLLLDVIAILLLGLYITWKVMFLICRLTLKMIVDSRSKAIDKKKKS